MTTHLETIRNEVEAIRRIAGDDEAAHMAEDDLHQQVLMLVADGEISGEEAAECAREAMKTADIVFERWCA